MTQQRSRFIGVLIVSGVACGSPTAPMSDGRAHVSGIVRDSRSDAAVAGAQVSIGTAAATTDANGFYALTVAPGRLSVVIDGESLDVSDIGAGTYLGDYYIHNDGCIARYGTVVDKRTRRPVPGASVWNPAAPKAAATDQNGWFRLNFGCPGVCIGFNTTFVYVQHPNYKDGSFVAGRGVCFVSRVEYELERK